MAGYVIADVEVADPKLFADFLEAAPATVETYGGRYLVRGGECEVVQGDRTPHRVVVVEFDSVEQAKAWYDSPEYAGPKQMQIQASASTSMVIISGV